MFISEQPPNRECRNIKHACLIELIGSLDLPSTLKIGMTQAFSNALYIVILSTTVNHSF